MASRALGIAVLFLSIWLALTAWRVHALNEVVNEIVKFEGVHAKVHAEQSKFNTVHTEVHRRIHGD